MKYFKFLITGCLLALATSASAQIKTTTTTSTTTTYLPDSTTVTNKKTTVKRYDKGYNLMPEVKLGSCYGVAGFGAGLVLEHELNPYLAWDIASAEFAIPFKFDAADFCLQTGLRGFTPRFWQDNVRGFLSVAAGYDCGYFDEITGYKDKDIFGWAIPVIEKKAHHGFGVSGGIGLQIKEHFFVGYTIEYSTAWKFTSHYGKFGYRF